MKQNLHRLYKKLLFYVLFLKNVHEVSYQDKRLKIRQSSICLNCRCCNSRLFKDCNFVCGHYISEVISADS